MQQFQFETGSFEYTEREQQADSITSKFKGVAGGICRTCLSRKLVVVLNNVTRKSQQLGRQSDANWFCFETGAQEILKLGKPGTALFMICELNCKKNK